MGRQMHKRPAVRLALAITAAVAVAGIAAALWLHVDDGRFTYDEQAHQRVIEAAYGDGYVKDWPKYRDAWLDVCESKNLALTAAVFIDGGTTAGEFALNIEYACPDRRDELPPALRVLD